MKIIKKSNFRVVVEPRALGNFGATIRVSDSFFHKTPESIEKGYMDRCREIADQIKRHVDETGSVDIEFDTTAICSHCGHEWEVDETGLPQCCQKAQSEFEESIQTKE